MQFNGLFIGLTTIDIQYFVNTFPKSNKKVKTVAPDVLVGGPATNAAVAFSKLNNGAFLSSPIGENPFKLFCREDFNQNGLTHFDIVEKQNTNPVIASVITSIESGDRNIFTHHPETINPEITPKELFENTAPEILLLDGFYPEFSIECAKLAKAHDIPVIIDGGSWKPQYNVLLEFTDVIICSRDFYPPNCGSTKQVINFLQNKNIKNIAISRGEKDILFHTINNRGVVSVSKTEVVDTLGAGDFLHGAFCFYYLEKNDFQDALKKASQIASFSCQYKGTRDWLKLLK